MPEDSGQPRLLFAAPQEDADWQAYYALRWRVLRQPWGQLRGSERDELEAESTHCLARAPGGQIVGCGRLNLIDAHTAAIRFMAVDTSWRGRGVGSGILNYLERKAQAQGSREIQLHARENALQFYLARGYSLVSKSHVLFGEIQHFQMKKHLLG